MNFAENVNSLLGVCLNTFGQTVSYTDRNSVVYELSGIFSNEYEGVDPDTGYPLVSSIPNLGIRVSDWPQIPQEGETIVTGGINYTVRYPELDGEGGAIIFLDKVVL